MNELTSFTFRPITTSHSIDNVFDYCARKFEFLTLYDKRPERDSGFAAEVGTALHDATQAWLIARAEGHTVSVAENIGYMMLLRCYPWELADEQERETRSIETSLVLLEMIMRDNSWDDWELVRVGSKWAVEVPFLIRHESLGTFKLHHNGQETMLVTQGKIDFILRHKYSHIYRTRDLKTTVIKEGLEQAEWKFSGQQIGYSNVLHAMLDIQPDKMEIDYLVAHFNGTQYPAVNAVTFPIDQDKVDDYWLTKIERLQRMQRYAVTGRFPRTNGGCHSWGHQCAFFQICESRDAELINAWFEGINAVPQEGYDYWVTLGV